MNDIETMKGLHLLTVGGAGAVALKDGKLVWVVAIDKRNVFHGTTELPPGVSAGSIVALACDRMTITLVTKTGEVHVFSRNIRGWVAHASLFEENRS